MSQFIRHSLLNLNLKIKKYPDTASQCEIDDLLSYTRLRRLADKLGTYVSTGTVQIDGIRSGEIEVTVEMDRPAGKIYGHMLAYYIPYDKYMIYLYYKIAGKEKEFVDFLFNKSSHLESEKHSG